MSTILVRPQAPLDSHWHEQLLQAYTIPNALYVYLMPEAARLTHMRQQFDNSSHAVLPILRPPETHRQGFEKSREQLMKLREMISTQEPDEHIRALYIDRIDELIVGCDLWFAAANHNSEAFDTANKTLYGDPNAAIYAASCAWLRKFATAQLAHSENRVRAAAEAVVSLVPDTSSDAHILLPDTATYDVLRALHTAPGGYFSHLFAGVEIPQDRLIIPEEGDAILRRVLQNINAPYTIADSSDIFWSVRHNDRKILRPAGYELPAASLAGIIAHEVGSHLLERTNGLRGPLQLLSSGLDRYESGNEGRAFMREQITLGSVEALQHHYSWEFNITKHLGICLGLGLNGTRCNFREVYEVLYAVYRLFAILKLTDEFATYQTAADKAWSMTARVLKGTDGQGSAYRKDIVYLEGNVRCWQIAKTNPGLIFTGDIGKFDITNQKHIKHLRALSIL